MKTYSKKVCLLGDFAVGKTSLVRRFVHSRFDDQYISTIGVKVSRKTVMAPADGEVAELTMMLWDLAGSQEFNTVTTSYLRGAAGAILVCDMTRADTLGSLQRYADDITKICGPVQFMIAANKVDIPEQHMISSDQVAQVATALQAPHFLTSAKNWGRGRCHVSSPGKATLSVRPYKLCTGNDSAWLYTQTTCRLILRSIRKGLSMLDILVAHLILQERKIAYVVTDEQLCIHQVGGKHDLLEVNGNVVAFGASLFELAPELIGSEEQLQAIFNGTLSSFQLELVNRETRGGTLYYVTLHNYAYVADHGRVTGILHIVEDVTFIGETHQRLTQQRNELFLLHDQLNRAALKLEAANAELRALDELKSKFVSIAAHELRTPLATILGYVDLMRNNPLASIPPDHQKGINVIDKSAKRLLVITNNLLDVTRIEVGRLELTLESLDLAAMIEEVALHLKPEIDQKKHRFTIKKQPDLPRVLCDESRTVQIFSNLLGNAIKYTPEQGTIVITLHHSTQEAVVIVAVTDNGIGIPAKDLQNIGKSFFRASNAHLAGVNGAGLGLSITRSLVELQGGQLWIESKLGEGSTFYLTVPIDDGLLHYNQYR